MVSQTVQSFDENLPSRIRMKLVADWLEALPSLAKLLASHGSYRIVEQAIVDRFG